MGSLVLTGDTSGSVTVAVPAVAGTNTATFPASTGTVMVSGNMPAFSAYLSSAQTISAGTYTKVAFNTKIFDTNSCYDNTTNYRFTPTVAGYYQVNAKIVINNVTSTTVSNTRIYKNGTAYNYCGLQLTAGTFGYSAINNTDLIYMNGSTDYLEVYGSINGTGTPNFEGGTAPYLSMFSASMVRSA